MYFSLKETGETKKETGTQVVERARPNLLITRHDASDNVELSDGSKWRIWPGDIAITLGWLPNTEIEISRIDDEMCSHVLINYSNQSQRVRVIKANEDWPVDKVRRELKSSTRVKGRLK